MDTSNYVNRVPMAGNSTVCDAGKSYYEDVDLMTKFADGVSSDALVPDSTTGRISAAAIGAHVRNLRAAGILKARPVKPVGTDMQTDMTIQVANDTTLYNKLRDEYCFYEQRYKYALKTFLSKATSRIAADNAGAQFMLQRAKLLNIRVNSVLEVMNYLAQERVDVVNENKDEINRRNKDINTRLDRMRAGYAMLSKDTVMVDTQKEMVRYTEEKNNYTSNQIAMWAGMNVLALAVIFYVYRN